MTMNGVKKKANGKGVQLKRKKHVPVEPEHDGYDSMVDNGTDEDGDSDDGNDGGHDSNESPDSGHESGAAGRVKKPPSNGPAKAAKRKALAQASEEEHRKRLKAVKALYRPPTVEELNRLKETENYYHSHLFRMQTEEMLKEVRVPTKVDQFVRLWVEEFKQFLITIPDGDNERGLLDTKYDSINFPLQLDHIKHEFLSKHRFRYTTTCDVRIFGGAGETLRTSFGKPLVVDLMLTIPDKSFCKDDYLNLRYHCRRAHFLCTIGKHLLEPERRKLASGARCEPLKGDWSKPVLAIAPADAKFARKVQFRLHAMPTAGRFLQKRFLPECNNIRPALLGSQELHGGFPTPHYNTSILYDIRLAKNAELLEGMIQSDGVRDAIVLLKVWARQRCFDQCRYGFDGGLITLYVAHLLQTKQICNNMSSYQIIRLFWTRLASSSWDAEGISFDPCHREALPQFFRFFEVVFLDPLGTLNITANLPIDLYRRVRDEAGLAIRLLDDRKLNPFIALFLGRYPVFAQYDHLFTVSKPGLIEETIDSFADFAERLAFLADPHKAFLRMAEKVLRRGLGQRISHLVPLVAENGKPDSCTFGIVLNAGEALTLFDKGPEAIHKAASDDFQKFWLGKAELRRFKDGSITESCVWGQPTDPIGQKRLIVRSIVLFLLNAHFDIQPEYVSYLASQFERVVRPSTAVATHETVEERSLAVIQSFDRLGKIMRDLRKLPLTINAILGRDGVFRYTDPDPPQPSAKWLAQDNRTIFLCKKPVHATIQLEASGKWPEELVAIRRLKTAFYLQIAKHLNAKKVHFKSLTAQAANDHLDVLFEKYVFRFVIIHQREIAILREYLSTNQVTRMQKDTDESIALEMQATILPTLSSALHGLHQQHFSFGCVAAIAKRWLYSQLIDPYLWPDECTELLLAALYLNQPLQPPVQPQAGFLRWLQFVASTDWSKEMTVVNFNDELDGDTIEALENRYMDQRDTFPPLTIITPFDGERYGLFGRRAPTMPILNRVAVLAKAAVALIEANFLTIGKNVLQFFQPSYDGYNVIIHLDSTALVASGIVPVHGAPKGSLAQGRKPLDPVPPYLGELREAYQQFAIFFYDPCGGEKIAVLWRPEALQTKPFTTSNINGRMIGAGGTLQLNVQALLRDFEILGEGLVKHVELRA